MLKSFLSYLRFRIKPLLLLKYFQLKSTTEKSNLKMFHLLMTRTQKSKTKRLSSKSLTLKYPQVNQLL